MARPLPPPPPAPEPAGPRQPLPAGVRQVLATLHASGLRAVAAGEPLHAQLRQARPAAFEVVSEGGADAALALFPHAVPTAPGSRALVVPTRTGPVDVGFAPDLEAHLRTRDFRVLALGFEPGDDDGHWIDPSGGLDDARENRLGCVASAAALLERDPIAALRAARLVSEFGYRPEPELESAMRGVRPTPGERDRGRFRSELFRLLLGPHVAPALALLHRTGVQEALAPGSYADSGAVAAALPRGRAVRLAAWLRGARASRLLQAWRIPQNVSRRVALLLQLHPVDLQAEPRRDTGVRRLLRRAGDELENLFALREAELAAARARPEGGAVASDEIAAARKRIDALRAAIERVREADRRSARRTCLALDGAAVMQALGTGPGPRVGRALRHLTDWIEGAAGENTPAALRAELARWAARQPD